MIKNKSDYHEYYTEDLRMTHIFERKSFLNKLRDRRFRFYKSLRMTEYYTNCRKDPIGILIAALLRIRHKRMCNRYQWTIPINVFDKGLCIVHVGTIVISDKAVIGKNCRIHVCVNIGNAIAKGKDGAPSIGDNVYIGPGAKIFGKIEIGDNVVIGANSVVNDSFQEGNCTIAGVPARIISHKTSEQYIVNYE